MQGGDDLATKGKYWRLSRNSSPDMAEKWVHRSNNIFTEYYPGKKLWEILDAFLETSSLQWRGIKSKFQRPIVQDNQQHGALAKLQGPMRTV
jgi:hypothetical protein